MIRLYKYFCGCWNMNNKTVHHFPQIQMTNESDIELYDVTVTPNENMSPILYKDTIPFIPPIHGGVVVKVYDGDTITIASKLPYPESPMYRFSVRLNGIDSPEIKGKTKREKTLATQSRDALANLIMNKYVILRNIGTEKYGRILADVFITVENIEMNLNQWMLDNHYAVQYNGGTKHRPSDWDNYTLEDIRLLIMR